MTAKRKAMKKENLSIGQVMLKTLDPGVFRDEAIGVIVFRLPVSDIASMKDSIDAALENLRCYGEVMDAQLQLPPSPSGTIDLSTF